MPRSTNVGKGRNAPKRRRPASKSTKRAGPKSPSPPRSKPIASAGGCRVQVEIVERSTTGSERMVGTWNHRIRRKDGRLVSAVSPGVRLGPAVCRVLAAVGHPQRARILAKLLEGPATYRVLQDATRLAAGPLYHHIRELREAGLLTPKQRDRYALTRGGRNAILLVLAGGRLLTDRRRCPP
ncbi:MAG: ArsR family transcriptional regulator [Planctomycetota bacterium]|nr:MAG: ArsR family transcriptional regulator [Planctomycetota bacterium]